MSGLGVRALRGAAGVVLAYNLLWLPIAVAAAVLSVLGLVFLVGFIPYLVVAKGESAAMLLALIPVGFTVYAVGAAVYELIDERY